MKTVFTVSNAFPANGVYENLEEARAALRRHGYLASGEYASCGHPEYEIEYWVNANALLLDLEQEAAKYAVSTDYLRHCFKLVNGISPYEFQLSQRYALAIRLLRETELPVGEIGDRCGFPVHRLFTQFIRKRSGFAPRELRKYM